MKRQAIITLTTGDHRFPNGYLTIVKDKDFFAVSEDELFDALEEFKRKTMQGFQVPSDKLGSPNT